MSNLPAQQNNSALTVIENMVSSGNFDVNVARELIEMQKDIMKQQAIINFNHDFSLMSKKIPVIAKSKKAHTTMYAPLEDIVKVVQPILSEHGFSVSFSTQQNNLDSVTITCTLMHKDGHSTSTELQLPTKAVNNSMNAMQAIGAAITYGKRYTISGLLNISTGDDDNNGFTVNAKTSKPRLTDEQFSKALAKIQANEYTLEKLLNTYELSNEQIIEVAKNGN